MKKIILLMAFFSRLLCLGQDIIILKSGDTLRDKIISIVDDNSFLQLGIFFPL